MDNKKQFIAVSIGKIIEHTKEETKKEIRKEVISIYNRILLLMFIFFLWLWLITIRLFTCKS